MRPVAVIRCTWRSCCGRLTGGFAILAIWKNAWVQPNDKFWEYVGFPASQLSAVHGKWLEITGTGIDSLSAAFAPFCNADKLVSTLAPQLTGLVKGKTIKILGHPALQLRNGSGLESIYVSISSKPEILRISDNGTISFSGYGARVTLTPPPASDVIKLPGASPRAHPLQYLLRDM